MGVGHSVTTRNWWENTCPFPNKVLSSVQFSHSVVSNSLQPHRLQHARPPCPSPTPGVYSKSCPLSQWCHPTVSSSVIPFSSHLQSFPASGSFPMSQFFASGSQSIGVSASASVLPKNIQDWFPLRWTGLISLQSRGLSRVFSNTTVQNHQFLWYSAFFILQLSHPYMTTGKDIALSRRAFVDKVISLIFNILARFSTKEQVSFNFMGALIICSDFWNLRKWSLSLFPLFAMKWWGQMPWS